MPYSTSGTAAPGLVYTASAHNVIVGNLNALGPAAFNVKQTALTAASTVSVASATTSADISGLTVSITPSSASSKVLVSCLFSGDMDIANTLYVALFRNGSVVSGAVGDAASNRFSATAAISMPANVGESGFFMYLDFPATTSAVTYSVRVRHSSGTTRSLYVNRGAGDADNGTQARFISTITAQEIPV